MPVPSTAGVKLKCRRVRSTLPPDVIPRRATANASTRSCAGVGTGPVMGIRCRPRACQRCSADFLHTRSSTWTSPSAALLLPVPDRRLRHVVPAGRPSGRRLPTQDAEHDAERVLHGHHWRELIAAHIARSRTSSTQPACPGAQHALRESVRVQPLRPVGHRRRTRRRHCWPSGSAGGASLLMIRAPMQSGRLWRPHPPHQR